MNNLFSYSGLIGARITASDKDLPVQGQNPGALITNLHCLLSNYYWLMTKEWKKKWLIHTEKDVKGT